MTKFKIGDWVECINFEGAIGEFFAPSIAYQINKIDLSHGRRQLISLDGVNDYSGKLVKAFSYRFIPFIRNRNFENDYNEYNDVIEAQDIYKSLIDG